MQWEFALGHVAKDYPRDAPLRDSGWPKGKIRSQGRAWRVISNQDAALLGSRTGPLMRRVSSPRRSDYETGGGPGGYQTGSPMVSFTVGSVGQTQWLDACSAIPLFRLGQSNNLSPRDKPCETRCDAEADWRLPIGEVRYGLLRRHLCASATRLAVPTRSSMHAVVRPP
jgi:hypothetical protein